MRDLNNDKVLTNYKEIIDVKTNCDDLNCEKVYYTIYTKDGKTTNLNKIK